MLGNSARIGAAAFALGLSLAGPHGVATADTAEGDSPAASAADGATQRSGAATSPKRGDRTARARDTRAPRPATPAATVADTVEAPMVARASVTSAETAITRKESGAARGRSSKDIGARRATASTALPTEPVVSTAPTVTVAAPTADSAPIAAAATNVVVSQAASVAGACPTCRAFGTAALPALPGQAATAILRAAQFLDGVQHWLSGLPSNPVTEFASGALLLLRRTLFPAVPVIAVGNVTVAEGSPQAVFTVTLDKPYTSDVTVAYSTVSSSARPWAEAAELAAFAEAGVDYQVGSGILTFTPGQTSQQVSITILDDHAAEVAQTFTLDLVTPVVVASATATIVDDDYLNIDVNPNFSYGDALLAAGFSNLAYDHRNADAFTSSVQATGWEGIGVSGPSIGTNEVEPSVTGGGQNLFSPAAGGFGVQNRATQSFAFAGKRTAADGTVQFIVSFEGSNSPFSEPQDWIANAGEYGWSNYYASLEPLMTEVVGQMLQAQGDGKNTQLILTGHSLGGAVAMVAYSDLLAPEGNLWPGTSDVLAAGDRVLDTVGGWSLATRTALLAATQVYTFGAPSMLIEPTKPGTVAATALVAAALVGGRAGWLAVVAGALTALTVNDSKLPDFSGVAGINFGTRVFQFEHANTSWWPPYPGDIVAQIGSRDPGNVLQINLDNAVQRKYAGWAGAFIPASTHPIGAYRESVIRLVTNRSLLKSPNGLAQNTPQLTQTSTGNGSDARNDFFVNTSDDGKGGNDLFVYSKTGSYTPNGGGGSDTYSITGYGVSLEIDGAQQSGRDSLIFDIAGTESVQYINTGSGPLNDVAVFSVSGSGGQSSSVKITHWDRWQFSDVFQVIKPADGSWTLNTLTGIDGGPVVVAVSPVNELPISVV